LRFIFYDTPKSFLVGSKWWNSNALLHLLYPHRSHFPPLYWINISLRALRLIVIY